MKRIEVQPCIERIPIRRMGDMERVSEWVSAKETMMDSKWDHYIQCRHRWKRGTRHSFQKWRKENIIWLHLRCGGCGWNLFFSCMNQHTFECLACSECWMHSRIDLIAQFPIFTFTSTSIFICAQINEIKYS